MGAGREGGGEGRRERGWHARGNQEVVEEVGELVGEEMSGKSFMEECEVLG